jgi:hypothetical protein
VTVTEYQPDSHFAAVVEVAPFRLEQQVRCSPGATGGARLILIIDTRAKTPLNLLLPLMRPRFEKTMRAGLRSIKRHVEGRPPADRLAWCLWHGRPGPRSCSQSCA